MGKFYGSGVLPFIICSFMTGCGDDHSPVQERSTGKSLASATVQPFVWEGDPLQECQNTYQLRLKECAALKNSVLVIQALERKECEESAALWLERKSRDVKRSEALIESQYLYCVENLKAKVKDSQELPGLCNEVVRPLLSDLKTICSN